jgi:hypothetical protein
VDVLLVEAADEARGLRLVHVELLRQVLEALTAVGEALAENASELAAAHVAGHEGVMPHAR